MYGSFDVESHDDKALVKKVHDTDDDRLLVAVALSPDTRSLAWPAWRSLARVLRARRGIDLVQWLHTTISVGGPPSSILSLVLMQAGHMATRRLGWHEAQWAAGLLYCVSALPPVFGMAMYDVVAWAWGSLDHVLWTLGTRATAMTWFIEFGVPFLCSRLRLVPAGGPLQTGPVVWWSVLLQHCEAVGHDPRVTTLLRLLFLMPVVPPMGDVLNDVWTLACTVLDSTGPLSTASAAWLVHVYTRELTDTDRAARPWFKVHWQVVRAHRVEAHSRTMWDNLVKCMLIEESHGHVIPD